MINYFKNDFRNVHSAIKMMNEKIPTWAIVIYYIVLAPVCLVLLPIVKIYYTIQIKRAMKEIEAE